MTETEMLSTIKRLEGQLQHMQGQANMLQQGYFNVGGMFRAVVQDLLVAIGDPDDKESLESAKKNAKMIVKKWDEGIEMKRKADEAQAAAQNGQIIQMPERKIVTPDETQ